MANVDTATGETPRKRAEVAEKQYVDAAGQPAEIEQATGLSYKSIEDGKVVVHQVPGAVPGSVATMLAVFGWSTLATNTASQNRSKVDDAGQKKFPSDADAVDDRFARMTDGDWGTLEREGGIGRGIDYDLLLESIVEVGEAKGETYDDARKARIAEGLKNDETFRKQSRANSVIKPVYEAKLEAKRPAKAQVPVEDILTKY